MQKEELFEEIDTSESLTQEYLGLSLTRFFSLVFIVLIFGIYIGLILYGTNSLEILFGLQDYEAYLEDEVYRIKHQNAQLQFEYFELKEISVEE